MEDKQKVLNDYYKAKLQLEILTLTVKEKQEEVLKYLSEQPNERAEIEHARFVIRKTPIYEFNDDIKKLESENKEKIEKLNYEVKSAKQNALDLETVKIIGESTTVVMTKK